MGFEDREELELAIREFSRHEEREFQLLTKWLVELKNRRVVEQRKKKRLEKNGELMRESLEELKESLERMGIRFLAPLERESEDAGD